MPAEHISTKAGAIPKKLANGNGVIQTSAAGTGVVRDLQLQTTGGKVSIGPGIAPQSRLDVAGGVGIGTYAGSAAAPSNGMIVSGSAGFGTNNPQFPLDVNGVIASGYLLGNGELRAFPFGSLASNYISLKAQGASPYHYGLYLASPNDSMIYYDGGNGDTVINSPFGGAPILLDTQGLERMRITSTGNVGIGTSSPGQALEIDGAVAHTCDCGFKRLKILGYRQCL